MSKSRNINIDELLQEANEHKCRQPEELSDCTELTQNEINQLFLDACRDRSPMPDLAKIKELFEHGANIKVHCELGFAAFKHATDSYNSDIMRFFLDHGADINEVIRYKKCFTTVWLEKVNYAQLEDLQLMLAHGAKPNDHDDEALEFLYSTKSSHSSAETEIERYQRILDKLTTE